MVTAKDEKTLPLCRNAFGAGYQPKDAIRDLEEAIEKGRRPLDPRNVETKATRDMRKW